jgi:hypothetical protein
MARNWFAVSRNLTNAQHDLHPAQTGEPVCRLGAWVDLLGRAEWAPRNGLERGQQRASIRFLAGRWNRSKTWVADLLTELEESGRISRTQAGRKPSVLTVCNYDRWQGDDPGEADTSRTAAADAKWDKGKKVTREEPSLTTTTRPLPRNETAPGPGVDTNDPPADAPTTLSVHGVAVALPPPTPAAELEHDDQPPDTLQAILGRVRRELYLGQPAPPGKRWQQDAAYARRLLEVGWDHATLGRAVTGLASLRDSGAVPGYLPTEPVPLLALSLMSGARSLSALALEAAG